RKAKPSEDGMPLDHQLAHIHKVRHYWLSQFSPSDVAGMADGFNGTWDTPITDLAEIKALLVQSEKAVRDAFADGMKNGGKPAGGYDHPVFFLQHMIWHEGWHVGLIFLGLRLAGAEPPEEWEEKNVWSEWRTE
ncbi:MAG TPA: DinB family protein, partial [Fimbriimonadaceae bacterium]